MHKPFLNINARFPCQGTIRRWKSWKYLCSNTRWCIKAYVCRGTCCFPVSGSSGVLALQGKTAEFPKTILFWESCGWASVFVPVCILKLGNFQGTDRVMRGHLVYTFEIAFYWNDLLSQSCEVSWGCRMKNKMIFDARGFWRIRIFTQNPLETDIHSSRRLIWVQLSQSHIGISWM